MKKIFLTLIIVAFNCHAAHLKVTKIIPDLNLYIFEHQYVVKVNGAIPHVSVGTKLEFDLDFFYSEDSWTQNITIWYGYDAHILSYKFQPIGVIERKPLDLESFTYFIETLTTVQPLNSFTSLFTDNNWFVSDKNSAKSTFPLAQEGGIETIQWVLDEYRSYTKGYKHKIYPVYDRNNTELLAAVINLASKRKVFLHDHLNSLALFEKQ